MDIGWLDRLDISIFFNERMCIKRKLLTIYIFYKAMRNRIHSSKFRTIQGNTTAINTGMHLNWGNFQFTDTVVLFCLIQFLRMNLIFFYVL